MPSAHPLDPVRSSGFARANSGATKSACTCARPHACPALQKLVLARLRAEGKLVGDLPTISFSAAR